MAQAIKDILNSEAVAWLAEGLSRAFPQLDARGFTRACNAGLEALELKQRTAHIAACMGRFLPADFPEAASIIARSLGPEVSATGENGLSVLKYFPHDSFIEQFGLDHPEAAFALQEEVTKRASCEFSIRAFLIRHPERTYQRMLTWAGADNAHLRRLASEGSRPRLPWGQRLRAFQVDPAPVMRLLEVLKDDPVRYVQRSVANSINDISKDWPEVAVGLCERWLEDATENRKWIVRHAMRDLVKKGHAGALAISGGGKPPRVKIENISVTPGRLRIGDTLRFSCDLVSTSLSAQDLIVDYVVRYVKARGGSIPKVFKLAQLKLGPKSRTALKRGLAFKDLTTRKHYPGSHTLSLQINGRLYELARFELSASRPNGKESKER